MKSDEHRLYACEMVENYVLNHNKSHILDVIQKNLRNRIAEILVKYKAKKTEREFYTELRLELIIFTPEDFNEYMKKIMHINEVKK